MTEVRNAAARSGAAIVTIEATEARIAADVTAAFARIDDLPGEIAIETAVMTVETLGVHVLILVTRETAPATSEGATRAGAVVASVQTVIVGDRQSARVTRAEGATGIVTASGAGTAAKKDGLTIDANGMGIAVRTGARAIATVVPTRDAAGAMIGRARTSVGVAEAMAAMGADAIATDRASAKGSAPAAATTTEVAIGTAVGAAKGAATTSD